MWPTVQRVPSQVTSTPGNTEQQVFSSRANSMDINGDSDEILERLVTFAYTELVTLVDTLPSRGESERRNELLKYTEHISSLLTKLLVLVRWAKNARHIQKCQNSIAYLDSQNRYFEYSVDGIYAAFLSMPNVRMRNYDVGNAVDILTTGSYQRLPLAISRNVSKPRLNKRQVGKTLLAIDDIIRGRMLSGEPVPVAMRQYAIGGGRIVFRVEGEFEATLTLLQHGKDIPWHVVGVKVLAGDDQQQTNTNASTSTNTNTWALVERAQQILVEASTTENEDEAVPQLAQLYDFLHRQSLAVLLETVARQATTLRRTRWEGALQAEMTGDRSALVLRYWASGRAAAGLSGGGNSIELRVVGQPVPRPIHAAAEAGAQAAAVVGDGEFARMERGRRDLIPKAGLRVAWTAHAGLAASQAWQRTAAGLSELADADMRLCLDSSAVDIERLLRQATWQHACAILDGLHAAVAASPALGPGAAQLAFVAASGAEVAAEDAARLAATPRLRAWFRLGEGAVDVTVDGVSGRLAVRAAAGSAALGETLVAQLADRANRSPWRIAELLVDLRAALALADLDALAERALGLRRQEHSAGGFPLRVAQADADMLARDVGGTAAHAGQRLRFYRVEGTEGEGEWFVMAAMTDRLRFRLVCLAGSGLVRDVTQVEALQVDRLFASVARRLSGEPSSCARAEAMLAGRTGIGLDYVNALASAVRARLAVRAVQAQLSARRISYAFRLPKFSTSPHGPRAAVSQELSVVGIDRMGLYELDEQVPVLYVPVAALMRAAPVNWRVAQRAVLPDEARRMVSLRVASDELDPTPLSDMRHIVPCHVVASMPVALDALPRPVAQAYADAVYFGKHAAPEDGGYHLRDSSHVDVDCGGYSKVVRVYRRVDHALQRLIRDWAELHLMAHVARHLFAWEQRALRHKVRLFQRNLHRLRPGASKIEQYLYRFREMNNKQNSARAPTFVVLPPAAVLCTRLHLVPVLRSLMHWLVQSVHVRDLLESAIARTQEAVEQHQPTVAAAAAAAVGGVGVRGRTDSLFCVKEKLVYTEEIAPSDAAAASAGGAQPAGGRQVMIVGFTGARDSVRCEFLMQAGVTTTTDDSTAPKDPVEPIEPMEPMSLSGDGDDEMSGGMALLSDLYSVPSTLMRVDLDVRIVPLNRPPNGITDAAAAHLMRMFKSQTTDIRQRAGVLVRILALPPQLVMDIIDIARKLDGKAVTCALADGMEHLVRIDALNMKVLFAMRFFFSGEWETVVIEYALVSGTAQVVDDKTGVWSERVAAAVAALDAQTAFTRDMGKSGKSRWFDIISKLSEGQTATL
ncbi:mediator complex subunit [Coemansia pectinata]|uniref:Mediator of RNA polymerase II transcription subunit 14 n=1 Tax=Coemansia pectinata TaxID=1052879 RepID=A0A9W8GVD2_9FUNG|nr:mediator complex subunit [Coemansia pectinata]